MAEIGVVGRINRVGWTGLMVATMVADIANSLGAREANGVWLGALTNHVGDVHLGFSAIVWGFVARHGIEAWGANPQIAKLVGGLVGAALWGGTILAEMKGVGNVTDVLDLPAAAIGLIGGAYAITISQERAALRRAQLEQANR